MIPRSIEHLFEKMNYAVNTMDALNQLLTAFKFERTADTTYTAQPHELGLKNLFGGLLVSQALCAANRTIDPDFRANSLHGYFLAAGKPKVPITYTVEPLKDGNTFSFRHVRAAQDGKTVFTLSASFQKPEQGFEYQTGMPDIKGPEHFEPEQELARSWAADLPEGILERIIRKRPIEIRHVNPVHPMVPEKMEPVRYHWMKAAGTLPDDRRLHQHLLAYASDSYMVSAIFYPHGRTYWQPDIQAASLDHALWFYKDFRMDDWLLHEVQTDISAGGRGLARGRIFSRDGALVAATSQEGLIRHHKS